MVSNFLFHEVSEKEREEIKKQAKAIMDSFSSKLSRVDKEMKEFEIERKKCEREEGHKNECCKIDREVMFANAPKKNSDFIIAERGEWKE